MIDRDIFSLFVFLSIQIFFLCVSFYLDFLSLSFFLSRFSFYVFLSIQIFCLCFFLSRFSFYVFLSLCFFLSMCYGGWWWMWSFFCSGEYGVFGGEMTQHNYSIDSMYFFLSRFYFYVFLPIQIFFLCVSLYLDFLSMCLLLSIDGLTVLRQFGSLYPQEVSTGRQLPKLFLSKTNLM